MNTLNIIKKQIAKAAAQHDAQITLTRYIILSVKFTKVVNLCTVPRCYRGRTYVKLINN